MRTSVETFERGGVIETTYERGDWTAATIINE